MINFWIRTSLCVELHFFKGTHVSGLGIEFVENKDIGIFLYLWNEFHPLCIVGL